MTGSYAFRLCPRWTQSAEEAMLAARKPEAGVVISAAGRTLGTVEWPGFRGAGRAGRSPGPVIATSWATTPPRQLWKIPVGPAWSSFAVAGNLLFTQEQRGPMETVVCYEGDTGREALEPGGRNSP